MDLYHADIRLPNGFVKPTGLVRLVWTNHADSARQNDRYGTIKRFDRAMLDRLTVVEVGVVNNRVVKILFRGQVSKEMDVCMVLAPLTRTSWKVITVWYNERNDSHATLDRSKYVQ